MAAAPCPHLGHAWAVPGSSLHDQFEKHIIFGNQAPACPTWHLRAVDRHSLGGAWAAPGSALVLFLDHDTEDTKDSCATSDSSDFSTSFALNRRHQPHHLPWCPVPPATAQGSANLCTLLKPSSSPAQVLLQPSNHRLRAGR